MFTDQEYSDQLPPNVSIKKISFSDYSAHVSQKLGINFAPSSPYKLCDLKPCLGYIHQDELTDYDFWAFGDIDVIYGDLQTYINDEMLNYDLISFHKHRISGHLCLLRNNDRMNNAFKKYKHWQTLLSDPEHRCFDEKDFNAIFMKHKNWSVRKRKIIFFFNSYMRKAFFKESYSTHFSRNVEWIDGSQNFPTQWSYKQGKLIAQDKKKTEIPYLHFMIWKKQWPPQTNFSADSKTGQWLINEQGFFPTPSQDL